jgi:glycosyltransferase involved in cell wall biosynthesis
MFNKDAYPDYPVEVRTTFLQTSFFKTIFKNHHNILTPWAFEMLDLREFDVIISVAAGAAKGIVPGLDQYHLSIILTPPRTHWDKERSFKSSKFNGLIKVFTPVFSNFFRMWDYVASRRADTIVTISEFIKSKIRHIYGLDSYVIYPGIKELWFQDAHILIKTILPEEFLDEYFLVGGRLYDYKKIDWAIEACIKADKKLVVFGDGPDRKYLEKLASKNKNILFLGRRADDVLLSLYTHASAFIFPGVEDFGLTPVESMACGSPVLAYNFGGVKETVVEGKTGFFFETVDELSDILLTFKKSNFKRKY